MYLFGEMAEWTKARDSKSRIPARVSGVQIPLSPFPSGSGASGFEEDTLTKLKTVALYFLLAVSVLPSVLSARQLRVVKPGNHYVPGGKEQLSKFVRSYTKLQSDAEPFERFGFYPTDTDKARIQKLKQGEADTVRVLCLRVEFVEDTTPLTTGNGKMDTLGFLAPDSGLFYDPPHFKLYFERQMEGLRSYFRAQSLGKLYVDYTVFPEAEKESYQLPRQMQFYGDTTSWEAVEIGIVRMMHDAFQVADLDSAIRFSDYDEFIVFHAGSGLQADFGLRNDSPFDLMAGEIPAGAIEAYLGVPYFLVDEGRTRIEQATELPEMMRQDTMYGDQTNLAGMVGLAGTLTHEFCHLLGAYDLYDVTGVTMGVGGWSLMGYGGWLGDYAAGAPPGVIPGFLDAYHRVHLGLVTPLEIRVPRESVMVYAAQMDTALFSPRGDTTTPTIVKIPITADEYFLLENRQVDVAQPDTIDVDVEDGVVIAVGHNEYDFFQPGSGILVWHVDESVIADYGPYNAINIFPERKGVDLEEGDGVQDFDVPYWMSWDPYAEIYGTRYDPFFKGGYNDRFTAETEPPSDGYFGKSYVSMMLLGDADSTQRLKDTIIGVNIDWDLYQKGFPKQAGGQPLLSAFAADIDQDDSLELAVLDTAGLLTVWRSDGRISRSLSIRTSTQAELALGDVYGDSRLEVVVAGNDGRVKVIPVSGAMAEAATGDRILASPVLADLDGDGKKDIIVGSTDGKLYAWAWHDSLALLPGFPVAVGAEIRAAVAVTDTVRPQIAVLTGDGRLFLYSPDASLAAGFPLTLSNVAYYNTCQPLVGDFDRDGEKEIAVVAGSEFNNRLFVVGLDGEISYQSREIIGQPFVGEMAAADLNADGYPDLTLASMNELFAFNRNATLVSNYPFRQDSTYETSEIAEGQEYAWIIYYDVYFQYLSSPVCADLDGDGTTDLAIGSPQYGLLGFSGRDGRLLQYFPLMTTGGIGAVPLAVDLDNDGDMELAVGSDDGMFYVWDLPVQASGINWGCAHHDPCHTGLLPDSELPVMPEPESQVVSSFFVYPNPAENRVSARYHLGPGESTARLQLLDMAGEPVGPVMTGSALPVADNETNIDLLSYEPGLYVVRLVVENAGQREVMFAKLAVVR